MQSLTYLYLNGKIISAQKARIDPADRGLLLGDGIFETMQSYNGKLVFLQEHWKRLSQGAKILNLSLPLTFDKLRDVTHELTDINNLSSSPTCLRLTVTRGCGQRGVLPPPNSQPTVILTTTALSPSNPKDFSLAITNIRRNEYSPITNIKSINYLDNILAKMNAASVGADDALFLNTKGNVTETTSSNIFIVKEKKLYTPPIHDGVLPGIMRDTVIRLCKSANIKVYEKSFSLNTALNSDEVFITNSILKLKNVCRIAEKNFNSNDRTLLSSKILTLLESHIQMISSQKYL